MQNLYFYFKRQRFTAFPHEEVSSAFKAKSVSTVPCPLLFRLPFHSIWVWDITEERVRGWIDAVHKYSSNYPVLFQAEDVTLCHTCTHMTHRFAGRPLVRANAMRLPSDPECIGGEANGFMGVFTASWAPLSRGLPPEQ